MSAVDKYIDQSYDQYINATLKFGVDPVSKKEYHDLLFSAGYALREAVNESGYPPYVIVKVGSLYMKAKKRIENLDVSFMDKDTFDLTTTYKENRNESQSNDQDEDQ